MKICSDLHYSNIMLPRVGWSCIVVLVLAKVLFPALVHIRLFMISSVPLAHLGRNSLIYLTHQMLYTNVFIFSQFGCVAMLASDLHRPTRSPPVQSASCPIKFQCYISFKQTPRLRLTLCVPPEREEHGILLILKSTSVFRAYYILSRTQYTNSKKERMT